jgi:protein phosphatase 1 regulatory subunit 11
MSNSPHPETFTRIREETPTTSHGSRTLTVEETVLQSESEEGVTSDEGEHVGVLRLRGDMNSRRRVIQWDENVIDNEHLNKKKTKSMNTVFSIEAYY